MDAYISNFFKIQVDLYTGQGHRYIYIIITRPISMGRVGLSDLQEMNSQPTIDRPTSLPARRRACVTIRKSVAVVNRATISSIDRLISTRQVRDRSDVASLVSLSV
jgi:hypothetical protein